jgi:small subunit ribosomal protein S6
MPNLYETLLIVTPEADDEGVNAVIGDLRAALEANDGKVLQAGVWQRRQLAYQVKGKNEGIYVLVYAEGGTNLPGVVKHRLRLDEAVLRHLVVRVEDPQEIDVREQIAAADDPTGNVQAQRTAAERRAAKAAEAAALSAAELEATDQEPQEAQESDRVAQAQEPGEEAGAGEAVPAAAAAGVADRDIGDEDAADDRHEYGDEDEDDDEDDEDDDEEDEDDEDDDDREI